jgi:yeeA
MADIITIENNIKKYLKDGINQENFFYDFISNYNFPAASITRARNAGKTVIKNKAMYDVVSETSSPMARVTDMVKEVSDERNKPRIVIATNFNELAAIDTKTGDSLITSIAELPLHADFFLPWNGIEKVDYSRENPADIKAASRFKELYHELREINSFKDQTTEEHAFNLFLIRLLFLLFAEDTDIMLKGIFTNTVKTRTNVDGSDLNQVISEIYASLDRENRDAEPEWLRGFPYVNGKLFSEPHVDLVFDKTTRELIIEAGELLNWTEINPDILGAMIQTVADGEKRSVTGMHYTSVENIRRVLCPLFIDNLNEVKQDIFDRIDENEEKDITDKTKGANRRSFIKELEALIERLSKIKVFDPACGSGNFLIIAYKELRRIEIVILCKLQELMPKENAQGGRLFYESVVSLNSFIGIDLDDFAYEITRLSLWIAEHQMNVEMETRIKNAKASLLPLHDAGKIYVGNSLRHDWSQLTNINRDDELYIVGNPQYKGSKKQKDYQKEDLKLVVGDKGSYGSMDYVAGWFFKAVELMRHNNCQTSFVTTNSICQGEQVALIWNYLLKYVDISFAYSAFKWSNNASNNAGVTVNIIGLCSKGTLLDRFLYDESGFQRRVSNITPYITENENIIVKSETNTINGLPKMCFGNMPNDGGGLVITPEERLDYIEAYPELEPYIKKYIGAAELIKGKYRYALWLSENDYKKLESNPIVKERIARTYNHRINSSAKGLAERAWSFRDTNMTTTQSILIPCHSSENREYLPMGIVGEDTIISNSAMAIYDAPIYLLGLLESRMHMTWMRAIGGKLETRYRYSAGLVYNTFPVPKISEQAKAEIEDCVFEILDYREMSGKTLAQLYDAKKMPEELLEIHQRLDLLVDKLYQTKAFVDDQERLSLLLNMYKDKVESNE